jgi:ADP-ribose pyrophosphatase
MMSRTIVYQGKFIRVEEHKSDKRTYEKAYFLDSVHVLPITSEGKVLFIREKRWDWEAPRFMIPSGIMDVENENPFDAAKREMEEEIAYTTKKPLESFYRFEEKGSIHSVRHYFLARDVFSMPGKSPEPQIIEIVPLTPDEIFDHIHSGSFRQSKSVLAYLEFLRKISEGHILL